MDVNFRWFEGEKAQFRFVPYDWAFLFEFGPALMPLTYDWAFLFLGGLKNSYFYIVNNRGYGNYYQIDQAKEKQISFT